MVPSAAFFAKMSAALVLGITTLIAAVVAQNPLPGLSQSQTDAIEMSSQFANAAYCPHLLDTSTGNSLCASTDPSACGFLSNAITVLQFSTDESIGGNIAVSKDPNVIVMSFKGTNSAADILKDVAVCAREPRGLRETASTLISGVGDATACVVGRVLTNQICPAADRVEQLLYPKVSLLDLQSSDSGQEATDASLPLCDGCLVHSGFFSAFKEMKDTMLNEVRNQVDANRNAKVIVTGHSLGGAVATIAGAYLRKNGIPCDIYTFGSPRVGNEAFANFVSGQSGQTLRITNRRDPVTVVPGMCATGYAHTTPELWFPNGRAKPGKMMTCQGIRHAQCSAQFLVNLLSLNDHSAVGYSNGFDPCSIREARFGDDITEEEIAALVDAGILDNTVDEAAAEVGVTPVADLPVADLPVADLPVADLPVADLPVADLPVADLPVADLPVADLPVADLPVADLPVADSLVVDTPVSEAPVAENPVVVVDSPADGSPVAETPLEETPAIPVDADTGVAKRRG